MPTPIITDGSMDRLAAAPRVVRPDCAVVFADRASRFLHLAANHAMGDYLKLMAAIARAQHAVVGHRAAPAIPAEAIEQSRDYGMPPLSALGHARDAQWRADLDDLLAALAAGGTAAPLLAPSRALSATDREALAERILCGTTLDADAGAVPFVGAALQVYFARLAASVPAESVEASDVATVCPVCATRPVASIVRLGGDRNNLRYLACALCSTEWNVARIKCTACESDKGVHYLSLAAGDDDDEPDAAAIGMAASRRAEACDECQSYLKIFYQEKDPHVDAHADDLASLALDVLVDERGFRRSGPNLLFHPGSA